MEQTNKSFLAANGNSPSDVIAKRVLNQNPHFAQKQKGKKKIIMISIVENLCLTQGVVNSEAEEEENE